MQNRCMHRGVLEFSRLYLDRNIAEGMHIIYETVKSTFTETP